MMYTTAELRKMSGDKESTELLVHYCRRALREGMEHLVETTPKGSRTLYKASKDLLCWIELLRRQYYRAEVEIREMLAKHPEGLTIVEISALRQTSYYAARRVVQNLVIAGEIKCLSRYRRKYVLITKEEEATNVQP